VGHALKPGSLRWHFVQLVALQSEGLARISVPAVPSSPARDGEGRRPARFVSTRAAACLTFVAPTVLPSTPLHPWVGTERVPGFEPGLLERLKELEVDLRDEIVAAAARVIPSHTDYHAIA